MSHINNGNVFFRLRSIFIIGLFADGFINTLLKNASKVFFCAAISPSFSIQAADKPNIVFIYADDLGFADLSRHGSRTIHTPNLDRLAEQGSEFYQFTVSNPVCSPSRAAALTGHVPARHSIHRHFASTEHHQRFAMPDWLSPSVVTLPKLLQSAGYTTAHFGKWHLTNSHIPDAPSLDNYGYDESAVFNGPGKQTDGWKVYDDTIDFIVRNKDKPFFINLWIHEPHTPHFPMPDMMEYYKHLGEQDQVYAAVVGGADRSIGRVLQALKDNGLEENTVVVFSSDNGPEITGREKQRYQNDDPDARVNNMTRLGTYFSVGSAGNLRGQKRDTYEGGVRVPFIVRWPNKVPAGVINNQSILSAVDLLPTFAFIAGVSLPKGYESDGENVLPQIQGRLVKRTKPVFWEWYISPIKSDADYDKSMLVVREGDWKLFWNRRFNSVELYNIMHDQAETQNVEAQFPAVVKQLKKQLLRWKKTLPRGPDESAFSSIR